MSIAIQETTVRLQLGPRERGLPIFCSDLPATALKCVRQPLSTLIGFQLPYPHEHSMADSLFEYCQARLPWKQIKAMYAAGLPVELHGASAEVLKRHSSSFGFTLVEKLAWKPHSHRKAFNYRRPELLLVQEASTGEYKAILAVMPGNDYIRHYASMLAVFERDARHLGKEAEHPTGPQETVVCTYPWLTQNVPQWTGLDTICNVIQEGDVVILGYVAELRKIFKQLSRGEVELFAETHNQYYHCVRMKLASGVIVSLLGTTYSFWGNLSCAIVQAAGLRKPRAICYVAKHGILTTPTEIHQGIFSPTEFCVFDRGKLTYLSTGEFGNPLASKFPWTNAGRHCSVPTVVEETYELRDSLDELEVASIDNEVAQMAQTIERLNGQRAPGERAIDFVPALFPTDYLRSREQAALTIEHDLTSRNALVDQRKDAFLHKVAGMLYETFQPQTNNIKAVVIGTGYGNKTILPALKRQNVQVVGLVGGSNREKTAAVAKEWGIPHVHLSLKEFRDRAGANLVFVASPHTSHAGYVSEALSLGGFDIVCEKPLALSLEQAGTLSTAAANSQFLALMNHALRFYSPFQIMHDEIEGSDVKSIEITFDTGRLLKHRKWNWCMDRNSGGGMVLAMATHFLDLIEFLVGAKLPTSDGGEMKISRLRMNSSLPSLPDPSDGTHRIPSAESEFTLEGTSESSQFSVHCNGAAQREIFEVTVRSSEGRCLRFCSRKGMPCSLEQQQKGQTLRGDGDDGKWVESKSFEWQQLHLQPSLASLSPWQAAFDGFAEALVGAVTQGDQGRLSISQSASTFDDYCRYLNLLAGAGFPI